MGGTGGTTVDEASQAKRVLQRGQLTWVAPAGMAERGTDLLNAHEGHETAIISMKDSPACTKGLKRTIPWNSIGTVTVCLSFFPPWDQESKRPALAGLPFLTSSLELLPQSPSMLSDTGSQTLDGLWAFAPQRAQDTVALAVRQ
jgi:hypothetical protein